MASGKSGGYLIGAVEIILGVLLRYPQLIYMGVATIIGTALTPTPPRPHTWKESRHYGVDQFENPRGPEAMVPILYGEHRVKPVTIAESVASVSGFRPAAIGPETDPGMRWNDYFYYPFPFYPDDHTSPPVASPSADNQSSQAITWLGAVCEGRVALIDDVEINSRKALSEVRTQVKIGVGNGTRKSFAFPQRHVYLGVADAPTVAIYVDGVKKSLEIRTQTVEFTMPADRRVRHFDLRRDSRREIIVEHGVRMWISGPGHPEAEQLKRSGTYHWSAQKLAPYKVRLRFRVRPPEGFRVRVTYQYLAAEGLAIVQDADGSTRAVFATAPGNGKKITATYRTTPFRRLRIQWRPGTLDQEPMDGYTDLAQSYNPTERTMATGSGLLYSTGSREVDDLWVGILAPRGLIRYGDQGEFRLVAVRVRIEYRPTGNGPWKIVPSYSGNAFLFNGANPAPMRWEIRIRDQLERAFEAGDDAAGAALEAFERGSYELRVTRIDTNIQAPDTYDDLEWSYVTEVLREGYSYPGTCLLGIRLLPNEALSGSSMRVSCVARRAELFDPRTDDHDGARDLGSSQNAALAIRDLITSAEGEASERYGGGLFFTGDDIFLGLDGEPMARSGFLAFADFCDQWVHRPGDDEKRPASATNGERRCRLNVVLDTPQSLAETVSDLAFLGYAFASLQGATWRFPLDQDGDPVFTFVDDVEPAAQNMSNLRLTMDPWGKTPSAVDGSFWSERLNFQRDQLTYPVADLPAGAPANVLAVDLRGCTREFEAARMLRHLAEQARAAPYSCTWSAHPGVQHVEGGDIVTLRTRIPYSTSSSALALKVRVLSVTVGRDEKGALSMRYSGRVMSTSVYTLSAVSVPASARRPSSTTQRRPTRPVKSLRARVA